jgi:putative phosphoribosyl transferase
VIAMNEHQLLDGFSDTIAVEIGTQRLPALLALGEASIGLVIFAHGSGSGRFSPRNNYVAERLRRNGLATLLLDLLTMDEERDRRNVFDIELLAQRLSLANDWASDDVRTRDLPVGYFGASTGAAAALVAAALPRSRIRAVVSRGGRPDLAGTALTRVHAPTLLIVGSLDDGVIDLNQAALARLDAPKKLVIVPGAGHLFEEPGTLDQVVVHASEWFQANLRRTQEGSSELSAQAHQRKQWDSQINRREQ